MSSSAARKSFEIAILSREFRVDPVGRVRRVAFIGEHTSRNTERDALAKLEELGRKAGLDVGLEVSGRGAMLWINPVDPPEHEDPTNDVGHPMKCGCPTCMPEDWDPAVKEAELEAGRGEKTFGA